MILPSDPELTKRRLMSYRTNYGSSQLVQDGITVVQAFERMVWPAGGKF